MALCTSLFLMKSAVGHAEILSLTLENPPEPVGTLIIESDNLEMRLDRQMHAVGNAVLRKDDQSVQGDLIDYDVQNDELHVLGNAKLDLNSAHLAGPEIKMRMAESLGEMPNATIVLDKKPTVPTNNQIQNNRLDTYGQSGLVVANYSETADPKTYMDDGSNMANTSPMSVSSRGDAKLILFEGPDKKRLKDARYTTCEVGVNDWYIKSSDMTLNSYTQTAVAKNASVEFKGVPILYSPYLSFSFSGERESGLLAPTIGSTSKSGFEVLTPYYWNISPNKDATFATRYLSKRGVQLQGEFRYLGEQYSGIDNIEYLNNDQQTGDSRYIANLKHTQNFGNGWSAGYALEKVSDDKYFSELSTHITSTSRVNLPQGANVSYYGDVWQFNGLVQKYQTLDGVSYPYQSLPSLNLNATKDWDLATALLTSQYTYFQRDPSAPIAATGSRAYAYPSIRVPLLRSYGYIMPKFGVNITNYSLNNNNVVVNGANVINNSASRTLPIFSLDSGLYFDRNVNIVKNNYTQTIEPRLYYVYVPYRNQDQLPVFDTALADLNFSTLFSENQFTGNDRINNANQLSLAVTTRMIDSNSGDEKLAATIGQRFYFTDQKVILPGAIATKRNTSDFIGSLTARLSSKWNFDTFLQYSPNTNSLVRSNFLARYNPEPGKLFNFGYRYTDALLEQIDTSGQWPFGRGWYGIGRWNYSLREKKNIEALAGIEYDAGCWQTRTVVQRVSTATANANYALFFQLELGGLASIGSNPLKLLRRDIAGFQTSSELPDAYRQQNILPNDSSLNTQP
ncbi:MAG: LPS-assembly protein LptD [Methylophilaceae bacterium]|nr:LPS-assembly protein LptD [Methylophilaceae bacterium]